MRGEVRVSWHNTLIFEGPKVTILGDNKYGQRLKNGVWNFESEIKDVICMSESFLVQTIDEKIYTWGWNEHGNLGLGDRKDRGD
jgi:alpha-tubulin suppressor-like RCC1 family protein